MYQKYAHSKWYPDMLELVHLQTNKHDKHDGRSILIELHVMSVWNLYMEITTEQPITRAQAFEDRRHDVQYHFIENDLIIQQKNIFSWNN